MGESKKYYDLEDRTLMFGKKIIGLVKLLPKNQVNYRFSDQIIRSGTSIGANYREANETETKKDFQYRIRICRKESKETIYWLQLLTEANEILDKSIKPLINETQEFVKIFAAILEKTKIK